MGGLGMPEISITDAIKMAEGVQVKAVELGIRVAVAVVDAGGNTVLFLRMDGTPLASSEIARGKAYTAVSWQRPSGDLWAIAQPHQGGYGLNTIDRRFVLSAGGLPIGPTDLPWGAIGVSGGTAEQDELCANAGLLAAVEPSAAPVI